eukprot:11963376-Alexandrium_andersonii.AAC.2
MKICVTASSRASKANTRVNARAATWRKTAKGGVEATRPREPPRSKAMGGGAARSAAAPP